jgi:hydroxyacylglutathione hydrolase
MALTVTPIPCLSDNYAYLLEAGAKVAVVDPSEAAPVAALLAARGLGLDAILNTHHHGDHTGGKLELKRRFGAAVVGAQKDRDRIPGLDIGVDETGWSFGGLAVQVLEVPGHTMGAIAFVIGGHAFTGDTLFAMGCGRLFEGDAATMWASLSKLMTLPGDTQVWCGHEYTKANGRFALTLEPNNAALAARMAMLPPMTMPTNMALEKATNPFLRPGAREIRRSLGLMDAADGDVFAAIRRRKDDF